MLIALNQISELCSGHPFRGSVPEDPDGFALAIQMRDISIASGIAWDKVIRTNLDGRKNPDWLKAGDILFVAKGARNFAVCLTAIPAATVCSQYFFIIRVKDTRTLLPEFLAWQINQLPAQKYLSKNAEGTDQLSIRRGVLEALPVAIPSLTEQQQLIQLDQCARDERVLFEGLIHNREQQLQALALQLFDTPSTKTTSKQVTT